MLGAPTRGVQWDVGNAGQSGGRQSLPIQLRLPCLFPGRRTHFSHTPKAGHFPACSWSGASRDRTGDLLLAKQISLSTRFSWCLEKPCKSACSVGHGRTRQDGARQPDAPLVHPQRGVRLGSWEQGSRRRFVRPAASAGGGGRAVQGDSRLGNRHLRVEPRHVLELVHHVPVGAERESSVVAELAGDVDHRAPLVEQQRRERVPEVVRTTVASPAASIARLKARRRHDWYAASVHGAPVADGKISEFSDGRPLQPPFSEVDGERRSTRTSDEPRSSCPSPRRGRRARPGSSARGCRATGARAPHPVRGRRTPGR